MNYPIHYIIRLFPEITIKSTPVRKRMTKQVKDNLRKLLSRINKDIRITRDWEKIDVYLPYEFKDQQAEVEGVLSCTPGVGKFSRVQSYNFVDLNDMAEKVKNHWLSRIADQSFCVRVRRRGDHSFSSMDAERYLGGQLLACSNATVKLKNPQQLVAIEIDRDRYHLVENAQQGLGGYPLGSQDSVLSLISGGFDSTVASYLCMKRGLHTHYCFFNLGGRAHELGVKEVASFLWQKYGASQRVKFITVPFEGVVNEILNKVDNAYMGVILKRMMYRAATEVSADISVNALVTGESVAQVSSQTLVNLGVIDEVTDMLTLRPLSVMDKGEIIDIARAIGTEDFAANMPEYCGVISVKPTTRAKRDKVAREEAFFDMAVLEKAIAERRLENIDQLLMDDNSDSDSVAIHAVPQPDAVVIDIRHPDEILRKKLNVGSAKTIAIPFFELDKKIVNLDTDTLYMLYCDRGVMSRLHAEILKEKGFGNIAVYRPE